MKHNSTTSGLAPGQLARLLALGVDKLAASPAPPDEADALRRLLASPADTTATTAGHALEDPATEPALIERIKRQAKDQARTADRPAERAAATAVYYAAIAHALLHQGRRISRHSPETLNASFADLEGRPWMPPALRRLFTAARRPTP